MKHLPTTLFNLFFSLATFAGAQAQPWTEGSELAKLKPTPDKALPTAAASPVADDAVQKRFAKAFSGITDVLWAKVRNGYLVSFTQANVQARAYLTKAGHCESLIRYYAPAHLPEAIAEQVKFVYPEWTMKLVQEVTHEGKTAYLISLENDTGWKVIRAAEGDVEMYEGI